MNLSMHRVSMKVGGRALLSDVTLQCLPGQVLGVVGENGAGKSTLLNVISGLVEPTTGHVKINGRHIATENALTLAQQRAVLPQNSELSFPLSAIEVVRLALSMGKLSLTKQNLMLHQCLSQFEAQALANRNYLTLSGGEKQRVQLARVLAQLRCYPATSPQYLLLDEPISALDLYQQYQTLNSLRGLAGDGIGVIAILHDLNLASLYCDRIAILKKGELLAHGEPKQVITEQTISSAFNINTTIKRHPDTGTPFLTPRVKRPSQALKLSPSRITSHL